MRIRPGVRACAIAWALAGVAAAAMSARAARAQIPALIADPAGGPPIWISEGQANNADGTLRWELFKPADRGEIAQSIESNRKLRRTQATATSSDAEACKSIVVSADSLTLPDVRLETFIDYATVAVSGRVRSVGEGFYRGEATALIEMDVDKIIKKPDDLAEFSHLYFLFNQAEVRADGELLCVRNDHYPYRPTKGRRVLLFAGAALSSTPLILNPYSSAVLFEREDGSLSLAWERHAFVGKVPDWSLIQNQIDRLSAVGEKTARPDSKEEQP